MHTFLMHKNKEKMSQIDLNSLKYTTYCGWGYYYNYFKHIK